MDRLAAHLEFPAGALWVKRDDATALGGGGNKSRKLDFLCADALRHGCDTLVTGGGAQSNHVRITAAAANRLGLACTVVLAGNRQAAPSGNVLLGELLAPDVVWVDGSLGPEGYSRVERAIDDTARRLAAQGRRPYAIPVGGASAVGALGYVRAAQELREQDPALDLVVVADGSGGTHAGLVAGLGDHAQVLGIDVGARDDLQEQVVAKAAEVARLAGLPEPGPEPPGWIDHGQVGEGYGAPTGACLEALRLAARLEGLVLDPVYSGKAMAGLIAGVRDGRIARDRRVVFLHTGGLPALFAPDYAGWLRS